MNITFRVDASCIIGSGHVMRCLVLAEKLRLNGHHVSFVCRAYPGNLIDLIKNNGFTVHELIFLECKSYTNQKISDDYSQWLWLTQEQDAVDTLNQLEGKQIDWIIVDHYSLDVVWEKKLTSRVENIMIVDDLANRQHDCKLLLDQNFYLDLENRYKNLVNKSCKKLLGVKYALIRDAFLTVGDQRKKLGKCKSHPLKNILIFMGGVDAQNMTLQVLLELQQSDFLKQYQVKVILGRLNLFKSEVHEFCEKYDKISCLVEPANYSELLANADLIIGAGGSSVYERCIAGIPSLVFSLAENQNKICTDMDFIGGHVYIKEIDFLPQVMQMLNADQLKIMSEKAKILFNDYIGALGVANEIQYYKHCN